MHAGRHYSLSEVLAWTRRDLLVFLLIAAVPCALSAFHLEVGGMPWPPIAVLGVAVAFVTGFKTNAAYGRLWEARQVWGAIVNASRAYVIMVRDFVAAPREVHMEMVRRHVAWLTALRHQLREPRAWETMRLQHQIEYQARTFAVPERACKLEDELAQWLAEDELTWTLSKKNRASALLALQSAHVRRLAEAGQVSEYRQVELVRTIGSLIDQQGKSERIKNFPYPRQFATLNRVFIWLFIVLLPFGVATELKRLGPPFVWLTIPITVLVAWVFHTMDKIGDASENPFEGGPNDVPITAMSRGIEIDLRDLLDDPELPKPLTATHDILM